MDIVIVGGGKVGEELCYDLAQEGHDIVLIEKNPDRLEFLIDQADIRGVMGNGAVYQLQLEAGVPKCDLFIAATPLDETNLISAITAKRIGAKYVIARVRQPEYMEQMHFLRESMGITLTINPEMEAAKDIVRNLQYPNALDVEPIANGKSQIVQFLVPKGSDYEGKNLAFIRKRHPHILICVREREGDVRIPTGDMTVEGGDIIHVIGENSAIRRFYNALRVGIKKIHSVLIVGAGKITRYLLPELLRLGFRAKVIDSNLAICNDFATDFPEVEVVHGDGTNQAFLREERVSLYDALVSLVPIDEENILLSLFGTQQGVLKTITKVNRTDLVKVIEQFNLGTVITPRLLVANTIIRFVRSLQSSKDTKIDSFVRLAGNRVEGVTFTIVDDCKATDIPIKFMVLKDNLMIAMIKRGAELLFPSGEDRLLVGDQVLILSMDQILSDIDDILE